MNFNLILTTMKLYLHTTKKILNKTSRILFISAYHANVYEKFITYVTGLDVNKENFKAIFHSLHKKSCVELLNAYSTLSSTIGISELVKQNLQSFLSKNKEVKYTISQFRGLSNEFKESFLNEIAERVVDAMSDSDNDSIVYTYESFPVIPSISWYDDIFDYHYHSRHVEKNINTYIKLKKSTESLVSNTGKSYLKVFKQHVKNIYQFVFPCFFGN